MIHPIHKLVYQRLGLVNFVSDDYMVIDSIYLEINRQKATL
jgi:hypothetical protein